MTDILYLLTAGLYTLTFIPWWMFASLLITAVHTADETIGEIWRFLHIPAAAYFAFQLFVSVLSVIGVGLGIEWAVKLLVLVRIVDVVFTHVFLRAPGGRTAVLLVVDAVVVGGMVR